MILFSSKTVLYFSLNLCYTAAKIPYLDFEAKMSTEYVVDMFKMIFSSHFKETIPKRGK